MAGPRRFLGPGASSAARQRLVRGGAPGKPAAWWVGEGSMLPGPVAPFAPGCRSARPGTYSRRQKGT